MKKTILCICMAMAMLLTACSWPMGNQGTQSETTQLGNAQLQAGYTLYESSADQVQFQYPIDWVMAKSDNAEEVRAAIEELADLEYIDLDSIPAGSTYFYDLEAAQEEFMPNLNYVLSDAPAGLNQGLLKQQYFLDLLAGQVEDMFLGDFAYINRPNAQTLGTNTFAVQAYDFSYVSIKLTAYQAMTCYGDHIYTFTYTTGRGALTDAKVEALEIVLSSIVFG